MRLHLCGPMRGLPHFNFQAFSSAAAALRAKGHVVTVPTEHDADVGFDPFKGVDPVPATLAGMIAWNLHEITSPSTGGIALLPGWRQSQGATLEALVAHRCGRRLFLFDWEVEGFLREIPAGAYTFELTTSGMMPAWEPA